MDGIIEFVLTLWIELGTAILPENKNNKQELTLRIVTVALTVFCVAGCAAGVILLSTGTGPRGLAIGLIVSAAVIACAMIGVGIAVHLKKKS